MKISRAWFKIINMHSSSFITAKQIRLQGRRGGDCYGMDRHKDRRAGLWHSDGLAINSTCMGLISFCTLATSFTSSPSGSHLYLPSLGLLGYVLLLPTCICALCVTSQALLDMHEDKPLSLPAGRFAIHSCRAVEVWFLILMQAPPCSCDSGSSATYTHAL